MIGPLLALAAAVALNGSYLLQHAGSVHAAAISPLRPVRTFASLLRSPLWTVGAVAGVSGWALHVAALGHAPLSIVQAFVAGGLALTVPAGAVALHQRLSTAERQALALMVAAMLALAVGLPSTRAGSTFSPAPLLGWTLALAAIATAIALRAKRSRAAALGVAGGLLYGAADLAIKGLTSLRVPVSPGGALWLAVAAMATAGAFFAFQRGLQGPRPLTVIALMTTATNVSSILGAFVVFGDPLGRTPAIAVVHGLAFALVAASAWRLAPVQVRLAGQA